MVLLDESYQAHTFRQIAQPGYTGGAAVFAAS